MKKATKFKRILSGVLSTIMAVSAVPIVSAHAEENAEPYPYTMFAASSDEGAITVNAGNFCVNGNVATNGTIVASGNMNINGIRTESAEESMIFIFDKIDNQYFSASNVDEHDEDYNLDEMNININVPTEVQGEATLTGNININNALKALEDVKLYGEVKNTNDSVIFSKYGDIIIESQNVNLNGLVYAPFGSVTINAQNLNLNNVVIIAESIVLTCPSVNANNSSNASSFVGTTSEPLDIPYDEWQYMKDENENDFPDFFEDYDNWLLLKDTDGDRLPDCVEEYENSDANLVDTDGDGLDDYYEVMVIFTDPTNIDTDNDLVTDDNEDFDNDGLTNYQEYIRGTSPWNSDSDGDDLSDGDEINTYGTNPLEPDSDFDGLSDADEIILGVLPNNPDTDGNGILDGDEFYSGNVTKELITDDPKVSAITGVSVNLNCKGNAKKCVTIENTYNIDVMSSDVVGIVGAPINITSSVEFDAATITFYYDEELLNGTPEENLAILWYDETNDRYVILDEDTVVDTENNTVSYTTTHFSTYLVIDREIWYDCWRENIDYRNSPVVIETAYDISFVVDVSGSMAGDRLDRAKTALNTFIDAMYPCDNACLVKFDDYGSVVSKYGSSISELKSAVSSLYASGGTSTNSGLSKALEELSPNLSDKKTAMIILICDGDVEYNVATMVLINRAIQNNIAIHTINVCDSASSILSEISEKTGGTYYIAKTSSEIASVMATLQQNTVSSIDMTDSDGDGLYDVYEVNGMKIQNGQIIKTDPNEADSDNDGVSDFDEIGCAPIAEVVKFATSEYSCVLCHAKTNPTAVDTDRDGYTDDIDPEPYDFTAIKDFGSDDYINNIESVITIPIDYHTSEWPYFSVVKYNKYISDLAYSHIKSMMNDVNSCRYTYLVSDENWLKFCLYFNQQVQKYGKVDREIHYFRLKLNRAPATLEEMINIINSSDKNDKWTLYSMKNTRYHMFGTDGEYNLKFGSSKNTGYIYEAVYNKDGILLTENNSPINMGTYNYCSDQADKDLHQKLDVNPYKEYGNTSDESSKYPGDTAKEENGDRFNANVYAQNHRASVEERLA